MSLELKFNAFKSFYDQGMDAFARGDLSSSRELMLKSAEICSDLATRYSASDMRAEFKKKSEDILDFIRTHLTERSNVAAADVDEVDGTKTAIKKENEFMSEFKPMERAKNRVKLSDIVGLEEVKDTVNKRLILALKNPETYEAYGVNAGGAILMYGPPGTGKTMLAKAVASEVDANFFYIPSDKLVDKYVGDTEKKIAALFETVRANLPAVLFFDEFDSLAGKRSEDNKTAQMTVPGLITQLDGVNKDTKNMLILAATNTPWAIDSAVLSRCKNLYLPLPNAECRAKIFRLNLSNNLKKDGIDYVVLADSTDGFSGRDIAKICEEVRLDLAARNIETGEMQTCTMENLMKEIAAAKLRVRADAAKFEDYNQRHEGSML